MKIGVFDSGIGGEAVAAALRQYFPDADVHTVNDTAHVPYGSKTPKQVVTYTIAAIQPLLLGHYDVIVLACNTATAHAIGPLRTQYPSQKFIGIEPMIKPAVSQTKTGTIAVFATPSTLASQRYQKLIKRYASTVSVLEPDCSDWASMIEQRRENELALSTVIDNVCSQNADVLVLGCTHYHWIKDSITEFARGRAVILEPSEAIGRRVAELLTTSY